MYITSHCIIAIIYYITASCNIKLRIIAYVYQSFEKIHGLALNAYHLLKGNSGRMSFMKATVNIYIYIYELSDVLPPLSITKKSY